MISILKNELYSISVSSLGAELKSFNKGQLNYIWTINEQFWDKTSPILFPIIGKLKEDKYYLNEQSYNLSRHGFARDYEFEIVEETLNSLTFSLTQNEKTLMQFPFHFELQIKYTLHLNKLTTSYTIQNQSNTIMPFAVGAHPAIAINKPFENYSILFENYDTLTSSNLENQLFDGTTNQIVLKNNMLPLTYSLFEKDAIVLKGIECKNLTIFENEVPYLKFDLGNFPHLGLWTKQNAPFLCIEPWSGYADSKNTSGNIFEKEAIQTLEPNQIFKSFFSIEIV